ncbi:MULTISPECIES: sugar-binding domain-containing protein [Maribacter]|uniref:Sugar-binding domain-containing protein n=1 Tax=Maribacter flavus TaxID=1658664 RepID=A0ABU7IHL4_9FLAO|nr:MULTISPECIES: sugar-binding domain-containing protein [Maribacter]MDC6405023.1 glycoside hydrolase family 2 [Maribacter sp. PR66]MEE1972437.1 sugar-binding domain-containing protein [Maribacter flavus]
MRILFLTIVFITLLSNCNHSNISEIDISGAWQVKLDSTDIGVKENWANSKFEGTQIRLPGTLDDAGLGKPNTLKPEINNYVMSNLARKHQYIGKAWYQKEINIPNNWKDNNIKLSLERVLWESTVYLDGQKMGIANSLIGNHEFELKNLSPGNHILTIAIDNSNKFPNINVAGSKYPDPINQDMAHAYTNHTQIKWNGILGSMVLTASEKNAATNLQVYPNYSENSLRVTFEKIDTSTIPEIQFEIKDAQGNEISNGIAKEPVIQNGTVSFTFQRPTKLEYWDEFNPALYDLSVTIDQQKLTKRFGYKHAEYQNGNLMLNGHRIFLRGNLECAIFPLTGHPPLEKKEWITLIQQAKNYGLNHLRFHSWCPPGAAFEAADELGFYFQVELPHWSLKVGEDKETTKFLREEADKILKDYGNHPSFLFMALGNELEGDATLMNEMVGELKKKDPRHLYMTTTFSFQKPLGERPEPQDEYFVTQWTDKGWIRGQGIFNDKPPHFNADYSENSEHIRVPLISHEIGQYAVYPDLSEIPKYTGVLEPLNFIAIQNDLKEKGLIDLAQSFTLSSGKLAALLYKEEIERGLKTPSFDGFQLLQLQDFPGQGTALVGLLNAFWKSKGIISPEEFSQFNSELVPLLRFEKAVYEDGETFSATIEVANFYQELQNKTLNWRITNDQGEVLKQGEVSDIHLTIGNNLNLGTISYPINTETARKLNITVSLKDTKYKNSWPIWEYPKDVNVSSNNVIYTTSIQKAKEALNNGKKVLLNPNYKTLQGIEGRFVPVFWSPVHFPNQPSTMGLLMDKEHPALAKFPTENHTNWQWWDLCLNSKSIPIDSLNVEPIVRVIDNFVTNRSLSNVFEAKIGAGTLVFTSIDLSSNLKNRPVARQLRKSLLNYMESDSFNPSKTMELSDLDKLKITGNDTNFDTKDIYTN